jgi:hypothetical protein
MRLWLLLARLRLLALLLRLLRRLLRLPIHRVEGARLGTRLGTRLLPAVLLAVLLSLRRLVRLVRSSAFHTTARAGVFRPPAAEARPDARWLGEGSKGGRRLRSDVVDGSREAGSRTERALTGYGALTGAPCVREASRVEGVSMGASAASSSSGPGTTFHSNSKSDIANSRTAADEVLVRPEKAAK